MRSSGRTILAAFISTTALAAASFAGTPKPTPTSVYAQSIRNLTDQVQPYAAVALTNYSWQEGGETRTIDSTVPIKFEFNRGGNLFGRWDGTSVIIYPVAFWFEFSGGNATVGDISAALFMTLIHEYLHQRWSSPMDLCHELRTHLATAEVACGLICDAPTALEEYVAGNIAALCKFLGNRVYEMNLFRLGSQSCSGIPETHAIKFCCGCCTPPVESNNGCDEE